MAPILEKRTLLAVCISVLVLVLIISVPDLKSTINGDADDGKAEYAFAATNPGNGEQLPWMDPREIRVIKEHMAPDKTMLEWGSGRSTFYFSKFVKEYYSIESDMDWCRVVEGRIRAANLTDKIHIKCASKSTKNKHSSKKPSRYSEYKDYINAVDWWNVKKFDLVLVDGRARPQCALKIVPFLHKDSVVFIHDWSRSHYHAVLDAYDIITETHESNQIGGGLIVALKLKPEQVGTKGTLKNYPSWWF
eukprot:TRINITY_DN7327_c0_g3_i1.p1 TRINITY_DN7327_c0_g3~~TRINITY_DN7327_c0_g3_i1.p1  ORF type:complete len:248 (-),score=42.99 TRINITY_DN7327_c0_g3_i1:139-882(-)